jgi:4-amino-4-deoxy-L-arabinose transferase-like glycosyltransferase
LIFLRLSALLSLLLLLLSSLLFSLFSLHSFSSLVATSSSTIISAHPLFIRVRRGQTTDSPFSPFSPINSILILNTSSPFSTGG